MNGGQWRGALHAAISSREAGRAKDHPRRAMWPTCEIKRTTLA
ncbi:hypothetical protein ANDA3_1403 [plant metagenome]|uniref:Uncharacterized protein n=1 Tax=plant metagenome TaxID=1297885 RepID=A0A484PF52_9ZZZZ